MSLCLTSPVLHKSVSISIRCICSAEIPTRRAVAAFRAACPELPPADRPARVWLSQKLHKRWQTPPSSIAVDCSSASIQRQTNTNNFRRAIFIPFILRNCFSSASGLHCVHCLQLLAFLISFLQFLTSHSLLSVSPFLSYIWFSYFSQLSSLLSQARVFFLTSVAFFLNCGIVVLGQHVKCFSTIPT